MKGILIARRSAISEAADSRTALRLVRRDPYNCRQYPVDEAPAAYKDFDEVLRSVKTACLASEVARLHARFVIKDGDQADD